MRLRTALVVFVTLVSSIAGNVTWAAKAPGTLLVAYPGYESAWHKSEGVPDGTKGQQALHMEKVNAYEDSRGSEAVITGVTGWTVDELGFDVRNGGLCDSAVSFRLTTPEDNIYWFGCSSGTFSPTPGDPLNWTRVRFLPQESGLIISDLRVVFRLPKDASGVTHLDNLDVNGTLIGKPGGNP